MQDIYFYAFATSIALIFGAIVGAQYKLKQSVIAGIMAFGAGMLICTLTFGLMEEAFRLGGFDAVIIGFLAGGLVFIGGDYLLHYFGARRHRRIQLFKPIKESDGKLIVLGTILDNLPESIALGIAVAKNQSIGLLIVVAIVIGNFSESISSIIGLKKEGYSKKKIFSMWIWVAVVTFIFVILSYFFLNHLSDNSIGIIESFAAGAILALLADGMMPEAFEEGGFGIAIVTLFGFLSAFILNRI
jgi:zinc transporter, ZIP family